MAKFKLTENFRVSRGRKLFQIQATANFGGIKEGDLGGWIEEERCLSQEGEAWVYPDANVFKGGTIRGGTIEGGTIWGGTIRGGTIEGGTIWGGTIEGGTIRGGTIRGGTIWGGTILGGTIEGGTIWGGTIEGGTIEGGTIEGGTIRGGTIRKTSDIFVFVGIGSEFGQLTAYQREPGEIEVTRGCFTGTLAEFSAAVKNRHGTSFVGRQYEAAISMIRAHFKEYGDK